MAGNSLPTCARPFAPVSLSQSPAPDRTAVLFALVAIATGRCSPDFVSTIPGQTGPELRKARARSGLCASSRPRSSSSSSTRTPLTASCGAGPRGACGAARCDADVVARAPSADAALRCTPASTNAIDSDRAGGTTRPVRRSSTCHPRGGVSVCACRAHNSPARALPSCGTSSQTVRATGSKVKVATAIALQPERAHCRFVLPAV